METLRTCCKSAELISVGLLIGANCTMALEPIRVLQGRNGGQGYDGMLLNQ